MWTWRPRAARRPSETHRRLVIGTCPECFQPVRDVLCQLPDVELVERHAAVMPPIVEYRYQPCGHRAWVDPDGGVGIYVMEDERSGTTICFVGQDARERKDEYLTRKRGEQG